MNYINVIYDLLSYNVASATLKQYSVIANEVIVPLHIDQ